MNVTLRAIRSFASKLTIVVTAVVFLVASNALTSAQEPDATTVATLPTFVPRMTWHPSDRSYNGVVNVADLALVAKDFGSVGLVPVCAIVLFPLGEWMLEPC